MTGTGLLLSDGKYQIPPLMQGGSGSLSALPEMPDFLPDALEAGTLNVIGAASLKAGIYFIKKKGMENIFRTETALCERFCQRLERLPNTIIYRNPEASYVPIVSFNLKDKNADETAQALSEKGFCLRAGLHCSPLAHSALGTAETNAGTVRYAPSVFSDMMNTDRLADVIAKL